MIWQRSDLMGVLTLREEIILCALVMLDGSSGGTPIRNKIIELTGKEIVYGTLYNLMEYLMRKGYVTVHKSDPVPVPGGEVKPSILLQGQADRPSGKQWLYMRLSEDI